MAINNNNMFDPSKRIRVALGEEFTSKVEAEAVNRIVSQANLDKNTTKSEQSPSGPVRNQFDASAYTSQIIHTNGIKTSENVFNIPNKARVDALENTIARFNSSIKVNKEKTAKTIINNALINITGFDKNVTRAENVTNAVNLIANVGYGLVTEHLFDSHLQQNKTFKKGLGVGLAGTLVDFTTSYLFTGNKDSVEGLFDPNSITSSEAVLINKTIAKEKLSYAVEHSLAGVVLPFVASEVINRFVPKTITEKPVIKTITSFGTFSSIGKITTQAVRRHKNTTELKTLAGYKYTVTDNEPCEAYKLVAKYATKKSLDKAIDSSIYGTLGGLIGRSINFKGMFDKLRNKPGVKTNTPPAITFVEVKEKPIKTVPNKTKPVEKVVKPIVKETKQTKKVTA